MPLLVTAGYLRALKVSANKVPKPPQQIKSIGHALKTQRATLHPAMSQQWKKLAFRNCRFMNSEDKNVISFLLIVSARLRRHPSKTLLIGIFLA